MPHLVSIIKKSVYFYFIGAYLITAVEILLVPCCWLLGKLKRSLSGKVSAVALNIKIAPLSRLGPARRQSQGHFVDAKYLICGFKSLLFISTLPPPSPFSLFHRWQMLFKEDPGSHAVQSDHSSSPGKRAGRLCKPWLTYLTAAFGSNSDG